MDHVLHAVKYFRPREIDTPILNGCGQAIPLSKSESRIPWSVGSPEIINQHHWDRKKSKQGEKKLR